MTGGLDEYLEKYSVAPAPSRDYYGIRIIQDEVKLFLWKISHGPHKTPQVRVAKFADFPNDKSLQDEIHRVFGKNVLNYVSALIAGKTKNSEDNSESVLARGWTRVFEEGRAMQRSAKITQCDKKRGVGPRDRSTGGKVRVSSRPRAEASPKTPLEVIKTTNPRSTKNVPNPSTLRVTRAETSTATRRVIEVSEKITRTKVTKVTEEAEKSREARSDNRMPVRTKIDNAREKMKKTLAPSKSTILKSDKSLITGSSSVARKNVDLDELIRDEAKKQRERASIFDSCFACSEDIERSAGDRGKSKEDSSSGNYRIENPWSSNSSIVSIPSPKEADKAPVKRERSYLTESIAKGGSSEVGKKVPEHPETRNETELTRAGSSAAERLDNVNRLATLGRGSDSFRSSKTLIAGRLDGGLAKNPPLSMEKRKSNSNMEIGYSRKK